MCENTPEFQMKLIKGGKLKTLKDVRNFLSCH